MDKEEDGWDFIIFFYFFICCMIEVERFMNVKFEFVRKEYFIF